MSRGLVSILSVLVAAVVLTNPPVVEPHVAVAAAPLSTVTEAFDEPSALAAARSSGRRVEVLAKRTERAQVFANPSGSMTMELNNQPVRVRNGDGWVPVDATLRIRDGWVVPTAAVVDVRFSLGGNGPLMVLSKGDKRLTLATGRREGRGRSHRRGC